MKLAEFPISTKRASLLAVALSEAVSVEVISIVAIELLSDKSHDMLIQQKQNEFWSYKWLQNPFHFCYLMFLTSETHSAVYFTQFTFNLKLFIFLYISPNLISS